jgi:hypothetical protein
MQKQFIPGIYNYCDRWCERCTFTSRCRNYESTSKLTTEQLDINNKAFWENISSNFQKAVELLYEAAAKHGFDLNQPMSNEEEKAYNERQSFIKTSAKEHMLAKRCRQYQRLVLPFVKQNDSCVADKARQLVDHLELGIIKEDHVVHTIADISDCYEIIQWYVYFIDAKLQRALHGKLEGEDWEEDNGYQKDSDGSARIALIAIEKSIAAWVRLYDLLPESDDIALKALALLQQLQQQTKAEFPKAMQFKRPGFDD